MTTMKAIFKALFETIESYCMAAFNFALVHWGTWGSDIIDALSTVASFLLVCVLIYKNILSIKKDNNDK